MTNNYLELSPYWAHFSMLAALLTPMTSGAMGKASPAPCPSPDVERPQFILQPGVYQEKQAELKATSCGTLVQISQDRQSVFLIAVTNPTSAYFCPTVGTTESLTWTLKEGKWQLGEDDTLTQISPSEFILSRKYYPKIYFERVAESEIVPRHFIISRDVGWSWRDYDGKCKIEDENGNLTAIPCNQIDAEYLVTHGTCEKSKREQIERVTQLCLSTGNTQCETKSSETHLIVMQRFEGYGFYTGCKTRVHVEGH